MTKKTVDEKTGKKPKPATDSGNRSDKARPGRIGIIGISGQRIVDYIDIEDLHHPWAG